MTDWTFFGDYSRWNGPVPSTYSRPILSFRVDSGVATDEDAAANLRMALSNAHIRMIICYVVYKPGQNAAIVARIKNLIGAKCPLEVVFMIDEESGSGFAGPGDHSKELNELDTLLLAYEGSGKQDLGYANAGDWANTWKTHRASLKRTIAKYSSTPPAGDWYAWQYSDGDARWPVHAGFPFVKGVDMNAIPKTIDQILTDFGITGEDMPITTADAQLVVKTLLETPAVAKDGTKSTIGAFIEQAYVHARNAETDSVAIAKTLATLQAEVEKLQTGGVDVNALAQALAAHVAIVAK